VHVVERGDTLSAIAARYGTRAAEIADANALGRGERLVRGAELIIPME
jgi:spore germination protein